MNNFTTCIFLNTKSEYDLYRFKNILSPSIKFLKNKMLIVNQMIDDLNIYTDYKIVTDDEIFINTNINGYKKQMMLKLYVSKLIDTSYYLILDSDVYVNKPFELNDLFIDGKIALSIFCADTLFLDIKRYNICCQTKWIYDSLKLQDKKIENLKFPLFYGVTPSLLITREVKNLLKLFDNKNENFLDYYANENNCGSEYSNYYIYVNNKDLYKDDSKKTLTSAVWNNTESIYDLDKNAFFWIIQSNTHIDNEFLFKFLNKI